MAPGPTSAAQIVQAARNRHDDIGEPVSRVTEVVFGNATDLHARHRMFDPHPCSRQMAIVPLLARRQVRAAGLFFGWRCSRTLGR